MIKFWIEIMRIRITAWLLDWIR